MDWKKARKGKHLYIPLWLHGDGVEFSTDSLLTFSFGPCLYSTLQSGEGRGLKQSHVIDHAYCLAAFPKSAQVEDTWKDVYEIISWSFQALFAGKHPTTWWLDTEPLPKRFQAKAGMPITEKNHCFVVWQYHGDLEYYSNCLHLPHWSSHQFCWLCNSNRTVKHLSPWDFQDAPNWECHSPRALKESLPAKHPFLSKIPGCGWQYRPCIDILHSCDLGVAARLCGSILHMWSFPEGCRARDAPHRMHSIWNDIKEAYQKLKISERFTNLTVGQFCLPDKPWAKPPILRGKAGEIRHLVPALALVAWNKAKKPHGSLAFEGAWNKAKEQEVASHMAACIHALASFYEIVSTATFFMREEEAQDAFQQIRTCLQHYIWLQLAINDSIRWQVTPKFHFMYHLGSLCTFQNPKTYWTYSNESCVGQIACIAHSCAHGTRATRLTESFTQKYLLGFQLRVNQFINAEA